MQSTYLKFSASAALFSAWCWLVYLGQAPAAGLVEFVQYALVGLASHGATLAYPGKPKQEPTQ